MTYRLLTAPTVEPLTLAEAKLHLRVDDSGDDTLIVLFLAGARQWAEEYCRRSLMPQTWRLTLDRFPPACASAWPLGGPVPFPTSSARSQARAAIALKRGPVVSVTSVSYLDATTGNPTVVTAGDYVLDTAALPATIVPAYGKTWPTPRDQQNAVTVDYLTGYPNAGAVPGPIRAAILLALGDLYANRESQIVGTIVTANPTAELLLGPYRVPEAV